MELQVVKLICSSSVFEMNEIDELGWMNTPNNLYLKTVLNWALLNWYLRQDTSVFIIYMLVVVVLHFKIKSTRFYQHRL